MNYTKESVVASVSFRDLNETLEWNSSMNFTAGFLSASAPFDNTFYAHKRLSHTIVTIMLTIVGVLGNLTTIIIFETSKKRWKREKIFIYVLAWTDLIALIHLLVGTLVENFSSLNYPDDYLCKYIVYNLVTIAEVSTYLLAVIAFQRFRLICRPARSRMSLKQKKLAIALSVLLGAIFCFPIVFFSGNAKTDVDISKGMITIKGQPCRFYQTKGLKATIAILTIFHYIAIISGSFCYLKVGKILFEKTRSSVKRSTSRATKIEDENGEMEVCQTEVEEEQSEIETDTEEKNPNTVTLSPMKIRSRDSSSVRGRLRKRNRRNIRKNFTFMFISIFVVNIIASIPTAAVRIHAYKDVSVYFREDASSVLLFFLVLFQRGGIFIHVIDPFIYTYFDLEIRSEAIKLFCGFLRT